MNTDYTDRCPSCSNATWLEDKIAAKILGLVERYKVLRCRGCGIRKLHPQLSEGELEDLYGQGYFNAADAPQTPDEAALPARDYISEVALGRHDKFQYSLDELKELFPNAQDFLDVGAATGDMVYIAKKTGLDAEGIEFSKFAIEAAKERYGLDLKPLALAELGDKTRYDLIHLNHVFEHFNDPVAELGHLHRLLRPGGGMYIEVPFQFHFVEKIKFRLKSDANKFSLESIHHPYFYTPANLKKMLRKNGFRVEKCIVYAKDRYPQDTVLQKMKALIWGGLSLFNIGNYIEIIATREADRPK